MCPFSPSSTLHGLCITCKLFVTAVLSLNHNARLTVWYTLTVICMQEQVNQPVGTQAAKIPQLKAALREGTLDVVCDCIQSAVQVVLAHTGMLLATRIVLL